MSVGKTLLVEGTVVEGVVWFQLLWNLWQPRFGLLCKAHGILNRALKIGFILTRYSGVFWHSRFLDAGEVRFLLPPPSSEII